MGWVVAMLQGSSRYNVIVYKCNIIYVTGDISSRFKVPSATIG